MKDEKQILVYKAVSNTYLNRMDSSSRFDIPRDRPVVVADFTNGVNGYVKVSILLSSALVQLDVYQIDELGNTIWHEKDAVNPLGFGRIFQCGQNVCQIVLVYRARTWVPWRKLRQIQVKVRVSRKLSTLNGVTEDVEE